jgi:hypothetical protein
MALTVISTGAVTSTKLIDPSFLIAFGYASLWLFLAKTSSGEV